MPINLDTHGNKQWVSLFQKNNKEKTKFFINSYQNAASYWFYSKEKPFYYQSFTGRKNHFTLLQQNNNLDTKNAVFANRGKTNFTENSIGIRGKDSIHINYIETFYDASSIKFLWLNNANDIVKIETNNLLKGKITNRSLKNISFNNFYFKIGFRHKKQKEDLTIPVTIYSKNNSIQPKDSVDVYFSFTVDNTINLNNYNAIGIGVTSNPKLIINRISDFRLFTFTP